MKQRDARPRMRYHCVKIGFRWHVRAGTGTFPHFRSFWWISAARVACSMQQAYDDGLFVTDKGSTNERQGPPCSTPIKESQ